MGYIPKIITKNKNKMEQNKIEHLKNLEDDLLLGKIKLLKRRNPNKFKELKKEILKIK